MSKVCKFCGGPAHIGGWCGSRSCLLSAERRFRKQYLEVIAKLKEEKKKD